MLTRRRRGFTLPEVLLVMTLLGIVVASLTGIIIRQQRFYASAAVIMDTRTALRQAIDVLSIDLRGLSPANGDIYRMAPTFIEFRANAGAGVVCGFGVGRTSIIVPPTRLARENGLSSWISQPQVGDSLFIFDPDSAGVDAGDVDPRDDRWRRRRITAALSTGACPDLAYVLTEAERTGASVVQLDSTLQASIPRGAAVRFFRRARYQLYQGSDGRWYLGYLDCLPGRSPECSTIQPVSGPYLPGTATPAGLAFSYFDDAGVATTDSSRVARIDVVVRAAGIGAVRVDGMRQGVFRDSLAASIAVRN